MQVVVLGGNSALGSYVVPQLAQAGHKVTCISDTKEEPYNYTNNSNWQDVTQIVLDRRATEAQAEGSYGKKVAELKPDVVVDTNCYYLEHCKGLVKALKGSGLKLLVHCGTLHVYSPTQTRPWRESVARGYPSGLFAAQQQQMEAFLWEEHAKGCIPITILLMGSLVGRGWLPLSCQGTYDTLVFDALHTAGNIMLPEQNQHTLQLLHAEDAAKVVVKCLEQQEKAKGEVFNVAGFPITLDQYATKLPPLLKCEALPSLKERQWWDFSRALAQWDYDKGMQATYNIFHCSAASNVKVIQALGVSFRDPLAAVQDALSWMKEHPEETAAEPRSAKHWDFVGLDGKSFDPVPYSGERAGYIWRDGKDGPGYYVDGGPFVNWQKQSIRRIQMEHDKATFKEGFTRNDALLGAMLVTVWVTFFIVLLLYSETAQGMVVFQGFLSNFWMAITRHPPKPFTKQVLLNSTSGAKVGMWHNMLPVSGYLDEVSDKVKGKAAKECKTVLYFHGAAENRILQMPKMRWYMEEVGAHVLTMDYRGFGDSQCPPKAFTACPTEIGVYEDAFMVYEYLTKPIADGGLGIHSSCIVLHGHGLGSAVASRLAVELSKKGKGPGGVILEAPFTSAWNVLMTSSYSPLVYLPEIFTDIIAAIFKPNLIPRFEQLKWIADFSIPTLMLHGDNDRMVPPHMSSTLYKKRSEKTENTEFLAIPDASHHNVMEDVAAKAKVKDFVTEVWSKGTTA